MHCVKKVTDDLYWIGGSDRRLALFENVYPIPRGVSYNSYVLLDEKTVLLDTVDASISGLFFENLEYVLNGRTLDYLIVNHMEPDHCAVIGDVVRRYPDVKLVCNAKTVPMLKQFFNFPVEDRTVIVKEMDTLCTGKHTFAFVMAPMVHWPEAMVSYDTVDKILFSADGFGTFGAINGNLFADEVNFERDWLDDARRYFINIVGKYGVQGQNLLKKAADTDKAAAETKLKALETQIETLKYQSVKVKLKSVKSNAKKTAKVTVRKVDGAEKYQITYSTKSNFKKAKTVTVKKASASVKKFKSKKTYYVKVRALKTIAGKTVKTGYSNVKKVKVK